MRHRTWLIGLWLAAVLGATAGAADTTEPALLAIVIDDIGYQRANAEALIALPYPLNFAVLPEAPHSQALAQRAWLRGKAVLLHIPMAALGGARLDPGGIDSQMPSRQISERLHRHFNRFPQAEGMNNHMGSLLTTMALPMQAVMTTLAARQRYFIDSRTSAQTVAFTLAKQEGVATAQRDVFLDNQQHPAAIARQLHKAVAIARQKGFALAIGHPYAATLAVLTEELPKLRGQVELVPSYALLRHIPHNKRDLRHDFPSLWRVKTPWIQGLAR